MTDLDTLRRALRAQSAPYQPGPRPDALDIGEIMARGRWLRRRRRLTAAGGAACLAVVLFAAIVGIGHLGRPSPVPGPQHPAGPTRSTSRPVPVPTHTPAPVPSGSPAPSAAGTPVPTASGTPVPSSTRAPTPSAARPGTTAVPVPTPTG
jgi:hypothetical protein